MPNVRGGRGEGFGGAATAGRNSDSSSRAARAGDARASAPAAPGGNQYAGYRGPIGTSNPNTSIAPGSYGLSSDETRQYNAAKTEYANRSLGKRVLDFFSPIKSVDPQINQPASYAAGQYHHGFNPAGLVAGTIAPYGSGLIAGPAAGAIYNNLGGHNVVLTGPGSGFSTSYPDGGPGYNSMSGYAGPRGDPGSPQGKGDQSGSQMAAFPGASAPGGAAFGPQPSEPSSMGGTVGQGYFRPKVPNHSLPYGFNSAFPNSLSEEDKAMLYATMLGRTA